MGLNLLIKREETKTYRRECHVTMEIETEVLEGQAKECQGMQVNQQKLRKSKGRFFFTSFKGVMAQLVC